MSFQMNVVLFISFFSLSLCMTLFIFSPVNAPHFPIPVLSTRVLLCPVLEIFPHLYEGPFSFLGFFGYFRFYNHILKIGIKDLQKLHNSVQYFAVICKET